MGNVHRGAALRQIHRLFGEGTLAGLPDAQLLELYVCHCDELAFKALVQRHGPMVLAVCQGVLGDANDADDAFQATFLLLVRKAGSLWVGESLGGWLHRVACRIAIQVKSAAGRRRDQERRAAELACAESRSAVPWDDVNVILHQEIDRLPERYRKPIVLCYLEGMTYQLAARHLGWSEGTTQGRLTRGRHLLRARLTRRGVTLAGAALGTLGTQKAASAVSMTMLHHTIQSARYFALAEGAAGELGSTAATALVKEALKTMMISKLKMVAAAALLGGAVTCVATGLAATGQSIPQETPAGSRRTFEVPPEPPSPGATGEGRTRTPPRERLLLARRTDSPTPTPPIGGEQVNLPVDLKPGGRLNRGDSVFSTLCGFRLHMRQDGNLVLYVIDDMPIPGNLQGVLSHSPEALSYYNTELWSTGTNTPCEGAGTGSYCVMHDNGNFVVYDEDSRPCFETGTKGYPGSFLRCQNDGNVVIYTPDLDAVWHSGTYARSMDSIARPLAGPLKASPDRRRSIDSIARPLERIPVGGFGS
jgi:RNA polymerase sigma factor (sigma-70 family)